MKTVTFAVMHFTVAFMVAYLITGSVTVGGLVAIVEPMVNTVGYFFHERVWEAIRQHGSREPQAHRPNFGRRHLHA